MKFLVILSSLLSISLAEYSHHYPIHIPIIGPKGVPLEPPEVVHARHAHLSHVAAVKSHYGPGFYDLGSGHGYAGHYAGYHIPVIGPYGVPLDTPEVQHAKAEHFAAHAKALSHGHYRRKRGIYGGDHFVNYHVPAIGHNGVPLDTPEVAAAKAAHFAEHAKAKIGLHGATSNHIVVGGHGGYSHGGHNSGFSGNYVSDLGDHGASTYGKYHGPYPELDHEGKPKETYEVQALKHAHFAAHEEAKARIATAKHYGGGHDFGGDHSGGYSYDGFDEGGYGGSGYETKQVYSYQAPILGNNGVPLETPEVIAAKNKHFAAHAAASKKYY